jgi:NADPH:quinone reductase-like Zn-dependent oxidoreductase
MQAIVVKAYGDSSVLTLGEVPEPEVGPGLVKVKVVATSLNPIDWKLRSGIYKAFMPLTFPAVLGVDASGTVVAVGEGVTRFKTGDRVAGITSRTYAQFAVGAQNAWAHVGAGLDLVEAAAVPLAALTGAQLLEEGVNPTSGQVVLVTGAVGAVGRAAVYAAKQRGVKVIAGVRGKQLASAQKLHADSVVALDDDAAIAALEPLDGIADTVGGPTTVKLLAKLKPGGALGTVVAPPPETKDFVLRRLTTHADGVRLEALLLAVTRSELVLPIEARYPLGQAAQAHHFAETGGVGKVLLTVS